MRLYLRLSLSCFLLDWTSAQRTPFEVREATIASVHNALFSRLNTCRDVVESFLTRIEVNNPKTNAIISLNPTVLEDADQLDRRLANNNATDSLFCVPILLKDNYDAADIPTTGGCMALNSSMPVRDSPTVAAFRRAGAIILGKTNLHEFALEGLSLSTQGGQTLNPYDFSRTPGGSSGGTGAAIAASFAVFGTGTDTVNSLRSPASANSLYSIRPSYGLISRSGVIPVSYTQDTVGPIGRCLRDVAVALSVMASVGYDPADNATGRVPGSAYTKNYLPALESYIEPAGLRIGVLRGFFNRTSSPETSPVNDLMAAAISAIESVGATIVEINDTTTYNSSSILATSDVQQDEFRELLNAYLASADRTGARPTSMEELYRNTSEYVVIPAQYSYISTALSSSTANATYFGRLRQIANLTTTLHQTFAANGLDAIVYPEQKNLVVHVGAASQSGRNGILAAVTGFPVVTVPVGFSNVTDTAPIGVPVGMEILGQPWQEDKLLQIARVFDDLVHARRMPVTDGLDETTEATASFSTVPHIVPSGLANLDTRAYPVGTFTQP